MMFILNFDYVLDEGSDSSTEKISPESPTKSDQSEYLMYHSLFTVTVCKKKNDCCGAYKLDFVLSPLQCFLGKSCFQS